MAAEEKKKYLIIHMGGTIGMQPGADGTNEPPKDAGEYKKALLPLMRTLSFSEQIDFNFVCLSTVDSNDINAEALEELVAYIRAYEDQYDGILITHGTDTMASTAAALNVSLHDLNGNSLLNTPIVLTGSQTTIHANPSDAASNFVHAMYALHALTDEKYYPITAVVFRDEIINGAHVIKVKESEFDAFHPVSEEGLIGKTNSMGKYKLRWNNNFPFAKGITRDERRLKLALMADQPLPLAKLMISPLTAHRDAIEAGGFVHPVDIGMLGSSKSYRPQSEDPTCLGILFKLAGVGNTGEKNLGPISNIVRRYGLPVYGALGIQGGHANQQEYAAGKNAFDAGIVSGSDVSWTMAEAKFHHLLANRNITNGAALLRQISYPFDLAGIFGINAAANNIPTAYLTAPEDANSFNKRHKNAISLVEAYRLQKGQNFRWLAVPQNESLHAARFLPRPDIAKILPEHQQFDFTAATGWHPQTFQPWFDTRPIRRDVPAQER